MIISIKKKSWYNLSNEWLELENVEKSPEKLAFKIAEAHAEAEVEEPLKLTETIITIIITDVDQRKVNAAEEEAKEVGRGISVVLTRPSLPPPPIPRQHHPLVKNIGRI